ncbi:hypothetical protein N826_30480 [Skermanella aerolata KACC 11604]|nr:hypothetical protein N826_30480 [Skermanella aerolata KACC 11604]
MAGPVIAAVRSYAGSPVIVRTASKPVEPNLLAQQLISQRGMNRSPADLIGKTQKPHLAVPPIAPAWIIRNRIKTDAVYRHTLFKFHVCNDN